MNVLLFGMWSTLTHSSFSHSSKSSSQNRFELCSFSFFSLFLKRVHDFFCIFFFNALSLELFDEFSGKREISLFECSPCAQKKKLCGVVTSTIELSVCLSSGTLFFLRPLAFDSPDTSLSQKGVSLLSAGNCITWIGNRALFLQTLDERDVCMTKFRARLMSLAFPASIFASSIMRVPPAAVSSLCCLESRRGTQWNI